MSPPYRVLTLTGAPAANAASCTSLDTIETGRPVQRGGAVGLGRVDQRTLLLRAPGPSVALPLLTASINRASLGRGAGGRLAQTTTSNDPSATWVSRIGWLERDSALVAAEVLELDAERLGHADQEIGVRGQRSGQRCAGRL